MNTLPNPPMSADQQPRHPYDAIRMAPGANIAVDVSMVETSHGGLRHGYNALIGASDAKGELGISASIVLHVEDPATGEQFAVADLREHPVVTHPNGSKERRVQITDMDGHAQISSWDPSVKFLVIGKAWNGPAGRRNQGAGNAQGFREVRATASDSSTAAGMGNGGLLIQPSMPSGGNLVAPFSIRYTEASDTQDSTLTLEADSPLIVTCPAWEPTPAELAAMESAAPNNQGAPTEAAVEGLGSGAVAAATGAIAEAASPASSYHEPAEGNEPSEVAVHMDWSSILASPEALYEAANDPENPEAGKLGELYRALVSTEQALAGNALWHDLVQGEIALAGEVMGQLHQNADGVSGAINDTIQVLAHLRDALEQRAAPDDIMGILALQQPQGRLEAIFARVKALNDDGNRFVVSRLHEDLIITDGRYSRVVNSDRPVDGRYITDTLAGYRERLGQGEGLQAIMGDAWERGQEQRAVWDRRREMLETIVSLSQNALTRTWLDGTNPIGLWEIAEAGIRNGRPVYDELQATVSRLQTVLGEVQAVGRLTAQAQDAIENR